MNAATYLNVWTPSDTSRLICIYGQQSLVRVRLYNNVVKVSMSSGVTKVFYASGTY